MEIEQFDKILDDFVAYFKVSRIEIFDALFLLLADKENLEWGGGLWDVNISFDEALKLLSNFDFNTFYNELVIEENIIPKEFVFETKVRIKAKGQIWIIHKNDADPKPSNPHAHNLEQNIKLDLGNGNCFRKREWLFKIGKKELLSIREKARQVYKGELPIIEIND